MAWKTEKIMAYLQRLVDRDMLNPSAQYMPLLPFMGLGKEEQLKHFGRPGTTMVLGGTYGMGPATRATLGNSLEHEFPYQTAEPDDGEAVEAGGATPTASVFAEDLRGTAATRWTNYFFPFKMRQDSLDAANGKLAVGSIIEDAYGITYESALKKINTDLWSGTLTSAQQAKKTWDSILGLTHVCTASNTYGQVDRSVETSLNPMAVNAVTSFDTTLIDLRAVRNITWGFTDTTAGTDTLGIADKSGVSRILHVTTKGLWNVLADEADGAFQITTGGIPNTALAGFAHPIIHSDSGYIISDPSCVSGEMYSLNLDTWLMELHKTGNFKWNPLVDKWLTEEGGAYYKWATLQVKMRLTCRAPWLNCRTYGLATS